MAEYTRRTLVRGAAWTVPVVMVAAQAPAFAASYPPITLTFVGGEKCPGRSAVANGNDKTYIFQFEADSPPAAGSVSASQVTVNGDIFTVTRISIIGTRVYVITESSGSSANASGAGSITYTSGMPQVSRTVAFTYAATPPGQGACGNRAI